MLSVEVLDHFSSMGGSCHKLKPSNPLKLDDLCIDPDLGVADNSTLMIEALRRDDEWVVIHKKWRRTQIARSLRSGELSHPATPTSKLSAWVILADAVLD